MADQPKTLENLLTEDRLFPPSDEFVAWLDEFLGAADLSAPLAPAAVVDAADGQLAHFSEILNAWKQELMDEVDRTVGHMKDEAANFPDPADRATQEEEFSLELRTRDRERKLIKKIDSTMERIEQDDYGFCDACGVEIGIKRLEARPTADLCIDCKTLDEIKEKQELG